MGFGLVMSWAIYGVAKKVAGVGGVESLAFESLLIAPLARSALRAPQHGVKECNRSQDRVASARGAGRLLSGH